MIIRYSMLQAYLECPKAFYDRYILNKIETEQSSALHFGTALHLGIRTMLEGDDGLESFNMYWDSVKDTKMKYYGQGWAELRELANDSFLPNFKSRHLKKFTDFEQEVQMEMPFIEKPVFKQVDEDIVLEKYEYEHTLQGTADYIGMYEGKLTIADWKTSSKAYPKNKILLNPQLYIYSKLYQHKTGKLPEQVMYKVFNKKDGGINTLTTPLTEDILNNNFKYVENVSRVMLRAIETKEFYHGPNCFCERS